VRSLTLGLPKKVKIGKPQTRSGFQVRVVSVVRGPSPGGSPKSVRFIFKQTGFGPRPVPRSQQPRTATVLGRLHWTLLMECGGRVGGQGANADTALACTASGEILRNLISGGRRWF